MKLQDVKCIGVVGAGVMGGGISQVSILGGYKVICRDLKDEIIARTRETIINGRFGLKGSVERGKITAEQMEKAIANLTLTTKVEDLKDCDVVIEAIGGAEGELENKDLKFRVFKELDQVVKKEAIFASNTSRFTIADLAAITNRKSQFLGMHFFSPVVAMKAVEVIWTADTAEENIQTIEGICDKVEKVHVRVKDVPGDTGFVGNRIFGVVGKEARAIVQAGICTPEGINAIMMGGFNWPVGPFGMAGVRSGWGQKK
jgi:3-hydroxybutyryl-CoA dehydrogenase